MYRLTQVRFGVVFALVASATVALADEEKSKLDPSGTWKWERTFRDNPRDYTLRLWLKDGAVMGTYSSTRQAADGQPREPVKIDDVKLEENQLSFKVTRQRNDRQFTIVYHGTITDDKIIGSTEANFGGETRESEFEGKRLPEKKQSGDGE